MNTFKIIAGSSIAFAFAAAILISIPQAHAESPDILSGNNLSIGSTGQGVVVLQGLLSEMGFLNIPAGIPFGYYGAITKSAVDKYQSSLSIYPSSGNFGPDTKIAMHSDLSNHGYLNILGWTD